MGYKGKIPPTITMNRTDVVRHFQAADVNNNGQLTHEEILDYNAVPNGNRLYSLHNYFVDFAKVDGDVNSISMADLDQLTQNNKITLQLLPGNGYMGETQDFMDAFALLDVDNDGVLSGSEMYPRHMPKESLAELKQNGQLRNRMGQRRALQIFRRHFQRFADQDNAANISRQDILAFDQNGQISFGPTGLNQPVGNPPANNTQPVAGARPINTNNNEAVTKTWQAEETNVDTSPVQNNDVPLLNLLQWIQQLFLMTMFR